MNEWTEIAVPDALVDTRVGRQHQLPAKDIAAKGKFPVIDQGQSFISGYCDDAERVINFDLPLVIFGDHTRSFKFVDFPFVLGADGTKVLKPDPKQFDAKYFYFAMLALDIPNRGYNRHYKILRERFVPKPTLLEQQRIAQVLSTVQQAIEQQERLIRTATELKRALLQKLFTEGLLSEAQKETEIGLVPESWEVVKLGSLAQVISKGSSPNWQGFEYQPSGVLFVRSQNVGDGRMLLEDRVYLPEAFNQKEKRSILKEGDLLINLVGASIGRVALGTADIEGANCNQAVCFVRLTGSVALRHFLVSYLLSPAGQELMRQQKKDIARANLSLLDVRNFLVPIPKMEADIEQVAQAFSTIEKKLAQCEAKRNTLQDLFRTLLHELMTGKVRVSDN
jgi:type I restriction enzyme S subunit